MKSERVAVMQPYIFPYIGYFQLIHSVGHFVFYDDVTFIKQGWINRNRILVNKKPNYFTIPCQGISSNKKICDISLDNGPKGRKKIIKMINQSYSKAPFFIEIFPIIEEVLTSSAQHIGDLAAFSVMKISEILDMKVQFHFSSKEFVSSRDSDRGDRLLEITKSFGNTYINVISGQALYDKDYFRDNHVELLFLKPEITSYDQGISEFVPGLSIIDILMFNGLNRTRTMLETYELV